LIFIIPELLTKSFFGITIGTLHANKNSFWKTVAAKIDGPQ